MEADNQSVHRTVGDHYPPFAMAHLFPMFKVVLLLLYCTADDGGGRRFVLFFPLGAAVTNSNRAPCALQQYM